jgi:hypothetical protein
MARSYEDSGRRPDKLREGDTLAGMELKQLVARNEFSSVWVTEPAEQGIAGSCLRVIPLTNLMTADATRRLASELLFWRDLSNRCAVELFDTGQDGDYCYAIMRYMPDGSLDDRLGGGAMPQDEVVDFAFDLADVLRELHGTMGPHGNLKPSNIFPRPGGGVLLSDFALPLWADEFDRDPSGLEDRLVHPYRAPEQRADLRDMDTRSDIYAFGLILVRCLTGEDPGPDGDLPDMSTVDWPGGLWPVVQRCLEAEPADRPGDAYELCSVLEDMLGDEDTSASEFEPSTDASASSELAAAEDVAGRLADARALVEKGNLDAAVDMVEGLPPDAAGMDELLDDIDRRQRACGDLVQQAVRLAEAGNQDAAMQAVAEAEQLWTGSETVAAVREDLARMAGQDEDIRNGRVPLPLQEALEDERYAAARTQVESILRQGPASEDVAKAVRRFKRGRVRKAFLDNIAAARRLYVLGHRNESREHWLEAANWLPPGPQRARLREIAAAALKGQLDIDVILLGLDAERQSAAGPSEDVVAPHRLPTDTRIEREAQVTRNRATTILVGLFMIFLLMVIILFWSLARR